MKKIIKNFNNTKIQLLIIALLIIVSYSNIFQNGFTGGDDDIFLLHWKEAYRLSYIPKLFTGDLPVTERATYRPIRNMVIIFINQLTGTNPLGYHLFSLFVILTSTSLVYLIVNSLLLTVNNKKKLPVNNYQLPFIVSLLFGLHPIHTEAITFTLGAIDSSSGMFFLAAFYFYIKKKNILSCFFAGLAFFSNEISITFPLMILFYDFCFNHFFKKPNFIKLFKKYSPYFLIAAFYLTVRTLVIGTATKGEYLQNSFYLTMLTQTRIFIKYLSILFWPNDLSTYPKVAKGIESYTGLSAPVEQIKSQSIFHPDIFLNILIIGFLIFLIFRLQKKYQIMSFAIGWFFISLLPVSNIFPLNTLIQERYAFLASIGFCLAGGFMIYLFLGLKIKYIKIVRVLIFLFFIIYIGAYMFFTYQRNKDYKDPIAFWSKLTTQIPNYLWANYFLANAYANKGEDYLRKGDKTQAIYSFRKALKYNPDLFVVRSELNKLEILND